MSTEEKRFVDLFIFKVTLDDVHGKALHKPYRVIAALPYATLYHLAGFILVGFDFNFHDVFGFYHNLENPWGTRDGYELLSDEGGGRDLPGVKRVKLNTVFKEVGKKMAFVYDCINDWRFIVELIRIEKVELQSQFKVIRESMGEAPQQTEPWLIGRRTEMPWTL